MQQETANDFYERIVQGTDYSKTISLEHSSGAVLEDVQVHPVDKSTLANVIQKLPEDMFSAVEQADSPEEAEEMLEEQEGGNSLSAMSSDTVEAFEELVIKSLRHPELTTKQMETIIRELDFAMLFELGGQIIDMSFSEGGAIKDFRERE